MNRLMIVEDDLNYSRNLLNYISNNVKNVKLTHFFVNGDELLGNLYRYSNEDIILLDLDIKQTDCMEILNYFKRTSWHLPYIVLISENVDLLNSIHYYNYVYKTIKKPFSFSTLANTIHTIVEKHLTQNINTLVNNELKLFKFNTSTIGYNYLSDSVELALNNEDLLKDIKNLLYEEVAKKYPNTNRAQVKWSIEKCVDSLYKTTNINIINDYFYINNEDKLTPKLFISTVVNNLSKKIS